MTLQEQFDDAQKKVLTLRARPSNDDLLDLYAFYKQATAGNATGKRPGLMDFKGRAKFDAWAAKQGMAGDEAMRRYVALATRLIG